MNATENATELALLTIGGSPAFESWADEVLAGERLAVPGCESALRQLHATPTDLVAIDLDTLDVAIERAFELLRKAAPLTCLVGVSESAADDDIELHRAGMTVRVRLDAPREEVRELCRALAGRTAALRGEIERHGRLARCLSQFEAWSAHSIKRLDEWVHEMRTPLGVIRGFSGNMLDGVYGEVNAAQARALDRIVSASQLLGGVVEQVRDDLPEPPRAEVDAAPRQGGRTRLAPEAVAEEVRELFAPAAMAEGVAIGVESSDAPKIWGERLRLLQAIVNLVKNALRFTPRGGRVTIGVEGSRLHEQPACRIRVSDTGSGIDRQRLNRIFESGFTTDSEQGHQGLGLAVVRQVVREHGGELSVASEPGEGTRFELLLPVDPRQRRQASTIRLVQQSEVVLEVLAELGRRRVPLEPLSGAPQVEQLCDQLLGGGPQVTVLAVERDLCARITRMIDGKEEHAEDSDR